MKRKMILCLLAMLSVLTTVYIFSNSLQRGPESNQRSETVKEAVEPVVEAVTTSERVLTHLHEYVRKAAHIIEFFLLGAFVYAFGTAAARKAAGMFSFAPLFYVLFVGVTDEWIQSFTDRTSLVSDVWIDFCGACCGMLAFFIPVLLYSIRKKRRHRDTAAL